MKRSRRLLREAVNRVRFLTLLSVWPVECFYEHESFYFLNETHGNDNKVFNLENISLCWIVIVYCTHAYVSLHTVKELEERSMGILIVKAFLITRYTEGALDLPYKSDVNWIILRLRDRLLFECDHATWHKSDLSLSRK